MRHRLSLFLILLIGLISACSPNDSFQQNAASTPATPASTLAPTPVGSAMAAEPVAAAVTSAASATLLPPTVTVPRRYALGTPLSALPTEPASPTVPVPRARPTQPALPTATVPQALPTQPTLPTATVPQVLPTQPAAPTSVPTVAVAVVPAAPSAATYMPGTLIIPRIGVQAAVEWVGLDAQGRMAVPDQVMNVAWYQPGTRPGMVGNAVISGHLDTYRQEPAVFWRLGELEVGDEIIMVDTAGAESRFRVTDKEIYPFDQAPRERIFGSTMGRHLNLITCNGTWDSAARNYDERLVVYTEIVP